MMRSTFGDRGSYCWTARSVACAGFRFIEKMYDVGDIPKHRHALCHYRLVLNGGFSENLNGNVETRWPSTLVFYPAEVDHSESHSISGRHFVVELSPLQTERMGDFQKMSDAPFVVNGQSSGWLAAKLFKEFCEFDDFSFLTLEGLMLELMAETSRNFSRERERSAPQWIRQAKQVLETSFPDPPSLGALANIVGVHPVHLAREFRRFQHCTVGEYLRKLRIDYARQQMMSTRTPLVEIALAAGFGDQTHFSRSFKRVTGMTPKQFKAVHGKR